MRTYEFRAYIKKDKQMVNVLALGFCRYFDYPEGGFYDDSVKGVLYPGTFQEHFAELEEVELMQFTGLKDKNGKEIYEDDLILTGIGTNKRVYRVMFDKGNYYGFPYPNTTYPWGGSFLESIGELDLHFVEVIGNVWESPELLVPTPSK